MTWVYCFYVFFIRLFSIIIITSTQGLHKLRYTMDFTRQPIPMNIYDGDRIVKQGFLGF
jgi:hypothetical protein